jgi:hypothetical protein
LPPHDSGLANQTILPLAPKLFLRHFGYCITDHRGFEMRTIDVLALAGVALLPTSINAQTFTSVEPDPNALRKEGFDIDRVLLWKTRNFDPLRDPQWQSMRDVRRAGAIDDDTPVLVFEAGGETLVLVSSQMSYHHVAQGEISGEPWMVTF